MLFNLPQCMYRKNSKVSTQAQSLACDARRMRALRRSSAVGSSLETLFARARIQLVYRIYDLNMQQWNFIFMQLECIRLSLEHAYHFAQRFLFSFVKASDNNPANKQKSLSLISRV